MNEEDQKALEVLKAKRAELGTEAVAQILGYAPSSIRVLCSGKYPSNPAPLLEKVRRTWVAVVRCPYIDEEIPMDSCFERSTAPAPYGGGARRAWWEACQDCPHKGRLEDKHG